MRFHFNILLISILFFFNCYAVSRAKRYLSAYKPIDSIYSIGNQLDALQFYCCNKEKKLFLAAEYTARLNLDSVIQTKVANLAMAGKSFFCPVRVLLDERKVLKSHCWQLSCDHGFIVTMLGKKPLCIPDNTILITSNDHYWQLNDVVYPNSSLRVKPYNGFISFDGARYQGDFVVSRSNDTYYLVNVLEVEDYLYSVLRFESWPGWPLEVNKAFAIACRTYLMSRLMHHQSQKKAFDIKATNIHQTYNGVHDHYGMRLAIHQTQGLVLTYNNRPIDAMFDTCCGGVIPAKLTGIDFNKAPYLARSYPCTFCKATKPYSWRQEYSLLELKEELSKIIQIEDIKDIKISKTDTAGVVQELSVKTKDQCIKITGKQLYSLLNKIKSFCYTVEKTGSKVIFKGRGIGHHLGICQWGARRMIDKGWNYQSILKFYYPGTKLMTLSYKKRKAGALHA